MNGQLGLKEYERKYTRKDGTEVVKIYQRPVRLNCKKGPKLSGLGEIKRIFAKLTEEQKDEAVQLLRNLQAKGQGDQVIVEVPVVAPGVPVVVVPLVKPAVPAVAPVAVPAVAQVVPAVDVPAVPATPAVDVPVDAPKATPAVRPTAKGTANAQRQTKKA